MNWSDAEKKEKRHQEDLDRLRSFRPMDDTFMRGLFKENLPLAELVLRIITGKPDLIVKCKPLELGFYMLGYSVCASDKDCVVVAHLVDTG